MKAVIGIALIFGGLLVGYLVITGKLPPNSQPTTPTTSGHGGGPMTDANGHKAGRMNFDKGTMDGTGFTVGSFRIGSH